MTTPTTATGTGLLGLVRRHPTTTFFVLAYGLSWLCWLPYVLSTNGQGLIDVRFPGGPIVSQLLGIGAGGYLGPLGAAFTVTALVEGRAGLRRWTHRLTHWRVGWRWYLAVLTGVPGVLLLATLAWPASWAGARMVSVAALATYLPVLLLQVLTTATAEEPGWRDFALPRLQARFGPLTGTVILGVLWGCWHLPLFLTDWGGPHPAWTDAALFVTACVPLSLVMTWVFNRSGESVPLVMVLHASINTFCSVIWYDAFPGLDPSRDTSWVMLIAATAAALVLLVATRGRLGLSARSVAGEGYPAGGRKAAAWSAANRDTPYGVRPVTRATSPETSAASPRW